MNDEQKLEFEIYLKRKGHTKIGFVHEFLWKERENKTPDDLFSDFYNQWNNWYYKGSSQLGDYFERKIKECIQRDFPSGGLVGQA